RQSVDVAADLDLRMNLLPRMLELIEAQLPDAAEWSDALLNELALDLKKRGFRVLRAPHLFPFDGDGSWPGISYINMMSYRNKVFVPAFGLGVYEERVFETLRKQLGKNIT